jgi:hypothetical protein
MFHSIQQSLFSSASSAWAIHVGSTRRLARQEGATLTTFVTDAEQTPVRASWHEALVAGRARSQQQRTVTCLAS